jgi:hypothetical protein
MSSASTIEADEAMFIRWSFSWSIINNPGTHKLSHWHPYRLLAASKDPASIAASHPRQRSSSAAQPSFITSNVVTRNIQLR